MREGVEGISKFLCQPEKVSSHVISGISTISDVTYTGQLSVVVWSNVEKISTLSNEN